jgi:hypothetical protein
MVPVEDRYTEFTMERQMMMVLGSCFKNFLVKFSPITFTEKKFAEFHVQEFSKKLTQKPNIRKITARELKFWPLMIFGYCQDARIEILLDKFKVFKKKNPHPYTQKNFFGIHLRQIIFIYGRLFEKRIFSLHDTIYFTL